MIALLLSLVAASALERPAEAPPPLEARPFEVSDPEFATLSNGLDVLIFTNREVPLWEARLVLGVGEYVDPPGREGLASLAFALPQDGAGDRSAAEIAAALQLLGGRVSSRLETDSAVIQASGIKRNLSAILDIWAEVIKTPTFPDSELEIARRRAVAQVGLAMRDPSQLSGRIVPKLLYGDEYTGRAPTIESLEAISRADVEALYKRYAGPENSLLLVGGDLNAVELVPLLEAALGDWEPAGVQPAPVTAQPLPVTEEVIYFIDNPNAQQSVIRSSTVIEQNGGPDWTPLTVANHMFARAFTGRVNMNLREDKGYTYGARCYTRARHGAGIHSCVTSVRTDATAASINKIRAEVAAVRGDRPLTDDEVAAARDALAQKWPNEFETVSSILDQEFEIWRYGLSEDRVTEYMPAVRAVDTAQANAVLKKWIVPNATFWLVVGDRAQVMKGLEDIGLPIVELDRTGSKTDK